MRTINVMLALSSALLLAVGCATDSGEGPDNPGNVSRAAKESFAARYPAADNVKWSVRGNYAVASFTLTDAAAAGADADAWFANGDGVWEMTATRLLFGQSPEAVQQGFASSKYGTGNDWTLNGSCDRLERRDVMEAATDGANSVVVYVIGVTQNTGSRTTDMDLYFSEDGILVSEVAGAPDDGYETQLPQEPAADIGEYLRTHIIEKGGRVIEIDHEAGCTEVEAILDGRKLELYFDAAQNWVYTETDFYRSDLANGEIPSQIVTAMRSSEHYTDDRNVDDIERVETNAANGNRTWWVFELETRWDDVDVYVDQSGLLAGRPEIDLGETGGQQIDGDIEQFISSRYPGARIIGREYDDGFLEVEILHENIEKELLFNGRDEWIRTEWEIRLNSLPEAVRDAVAQAGYAFDDDEADVVESPGGICYEVEVRDGRTELKLTIAADGTILRTEYDD